MDCQERGVRNCTELNINERIPKSLTCQTSWFMLMQFHSWPHTICKHIVLPYAAIYNVTGMDVIREKYCYNKPETGIASRQLLVIE